MKMMAIVLAGTMSVSALWDRLTRETNSHAAAARGSNSYAAQKYEAAARAFGDAAALSPSPKSAFNLGTSQIAAGRRAEGSATLARAMGEPGLRAPAFYNRGNSALAAKAYEHAVRDYIESLKLTPNDAQAKRNLEIALHQLQSMQQSQRGGEQQQPQTPQPQESQQEPERTREEEGEDQADAEALLRSVQQQEQEELSRMKRVRASKARVGW